MIQDERVRTLNSQSIQHRPYVVYWMQASQRTEYNHALEYAIGLANDLNRPMLVCFGITSDYPEANLRHYRFMLEGLQETHLKLKERGISLVTRIQPPEIMAAEMSSVAAAVVVDCGYTEIQRIWRRSAAQRLDCPLIQVEADVVVPVETASRKEAYAAADFRRNISKTMQDYLVPLHPLSLRRRAAEIDIESTDITNVDDVLARLTLDAGAGAVKAYTGGESHAAALLDHFIAHKLDKYADLRNDPSTDYQSGLSPYLHFGQISPLQIALSVRNAGGRGVQAYLEELIVRRELAINYVYYNRDHATYRGLPDWARSTLEEHAKDGREASYSPEQLERAETYDTYWNAAQMEMLATGKMHGYMRMYWGKRIIEWTESPQEAFRIALYLNNKYELDGRDPNSYAGVAWCFGKHDRPWPERAVFGRVRTMTQNGLKRKFDVDAYVGRVNQVSQ